MSALLSFDLAARKRAIAPDASLAALADGLAAELEPLRAAVSSGNAPVPLQKARLTRVGGRCPVHGTLLDFDPWRPHHHHCARCARDYVASEHDDWWAMNAQLWTVERAVHAGALYVLRGEAQHAELAESILGILADRYTTWPNRDNVLGPSRPFFSTYLESIWLLNAAHALALLESAGRDAMGDRIRDQLLAPSSALIASYPEGRSNRQVWNEVAVLSAWTLLGRDADIERRWGNPGSLPWLLEHALLGDGSWYEGENYHLFAHRGLWYGVQWMRATGRELPPHLDARFHQGFATPLVGVLPDDTLPARRDSQYGISIRQWRMAEHLELGLAHRPHRVLSAWLARLYAPPASGHAVARRGRRLSTADAERHDAPGMLSRADLSWRALLAASEHEVADGAVSPGSAFLPSQGLAVIRRDRGRVYVALEGGDTGGGHGHPDRLSLTLQDGAARVLDDPGTGSYVEKALHWYRSTLAHHAPLVNNASQQREPATLLAFEDRGGAGWMRKTVTGLAPGVSATRTIVVCDGHLVDIVEWHADQAVTLTLPVATQAQLDGEHTWRAVTRIGVGGLEDGFDFLSNVAVSSEANEVELRGAGTPVAFTSMGMRAWYASSQPSRWLRADAPAPPLPPSDAHAPANRASSVPSVPRHWIEAEGTSGTIVGVWAWSATNTATDVVAVEFPALASRSVEPMPAKADPESLVRVHTADGTVSAHRPVVTGWQIGLTAGRARSSIDLDLLPVVESPSASQTDTAFTSATMPPPPVRIPALAGDSVSAPPLTQPLPGAVQWVLGAAHYRQTETPWEFAGRPSATIELASYGTQLIARLHIRHDRDVVPRFATGASDRMPDNPLDNERADVNVCGVQWYATGDGQGWQDAGLVVPLAGDPGVCRSTSLVPPSGQGVLGIPPTSTWREVEDGWLLQLVWSMNPQYRGPQSFGLQLVVNDAVAGRERRQGQLALSGGGGFAYLRGDRESPVDALPVMRAGHPST